MGYFEYLCQLCGVSFAIARLRRPDEPPEAAWDYAGFSYVHETEFLAGLCGESSGCQILRHDSAGGEEHAAGTGCRCRRGYSGQRISLEEMKGCRAVQCLLEKEEKWQPQPDDQDFELDSKYFLSGVGDGSPDEGPLEELTPVRHGVNSTLITNCIYGNEDDKDGLPFHPTCFEIFKRISKLRMGVVDVEGLWHWRLLEGTFEAFHEEFPRETAVRDGYEQFWNHEPGCEYLAANPVEVPGLPQLLTSAHSTHSNAPRTVFGWPSQPDQRSAELRRLPPSTPGAGSDPFTKLPAELTNMTLNYLHSKDIAALRHVSRAFRQMPTILFRRLIIEEMPWFWEAQDQPLGGTDWHKLYRSVKSDGSTFKGLRNRRRIWKDVEEIVRRMGEYRRNGEIG